MAVTTTVGQSGLYTKTGSSSPHPLLTTTTGTNSFSIVDVVETTGSGGVFVTKYTLRCGPGISIAISDYPTGNAVSFTELSMVVT